MSLIPWLKKFSSGEIDLILGSASQPRKKILQQLQIPFTVVASDFNEDLDKESFLLDLSEYPLATADEKARDILTRLEITKPTILVTCDTVAILDKKLILEKPLNRQRGIEMTLSMSGKEHDVVTGVVVTFLDEGVYDRISFKSTSIVTFADLEKSEVDSYVETGEALDKAGGYSIQGIGELLIKELKGSFTNVVGLPLHELAVTLALLLSRNMEPK